MHNSVNQYEGGIDAGCCHSKPLVFIKSELAEESVSIKKAEKHQESDANAKRTKPHSPLYDTDTSGIIPQNASFNSTVAIQTREWEPPEVVHAKEILKKIEALRKISEKDWLKPGRLYSEGWYFQETPEAKGEHFHILKSLYILQAISARVLSERLVASNMKARRKHIAASTGNWTLCGRSFIMGRLGGP